MLFVTKPHSSCSVLNCPLVDTPYQEQDYCILTTFYQEVILRQIKAIQTKIFFGC